jgi:hypothetical protein
MVSETFIDGVIRKSEELMPRETKRWLTYSGALQYKT